MFALRVEYLFNCEMVVVVFPVQYMYKNNQAQTYPLHNKT